MCGVEALLITAITATVAAGGLTAYGQIQQGKAASAAATYQAAVDRNNAVIAKHQADDAIKRGEIKEKQHRQLIAQMIGDQTAAFAANNVALDEGSPLDVIADTAMIGELEALTIRYNAEREAQGFLQQEQNLQAQSNLRLLEAENARTGSLLAAGGTVLGTAASASGLAFQGVSSGAFSSTPPPAAAPPLTKSDERIKVDVERVGTIPRFNMPVYTYRLIGEATKYIGVMAQDVLAKIPKAVWSDERGLLYVDYSKVNPYANIQMPVAVS